MERKSPAELVRTRLLEAEAWEWRVSANAGCQGPPATSPKTAAIASKREYCMSHKTRANLNSLGKLEWEFSQRRSADGSFGLHRAGEATPAKKDANLKKVRPTPGKVADCDNRRRRMGSVGRSRSVFLSCGIWRGAVLRITIPQRL